MQMSTVKVLNRKIDQDILGMLSGASTTLGGAQSMTLALATRAKTTCSSSVRRRCAPI
jgi:hypothetical protein